MKAGKLKDKIEIYNPVIVKSEFGSNKTEYKLFYATRAEIKYNSGSKVVENNEVINTTTITITLRYYVPLLENMNIKYNEKMYRILSIEPSKQYNNKIIIAEMINE